MRGNSKKIGTCFFLILIILILFQGKQEQGISFLSPRTQVAMSLDDIARSFLKRDAKGRFSVDQAVQVSMLLFRKTQGSTFNLLSGAMFPGEDSYAVAAFPERCEKIPSAKFSSDVLKAFILKNLDLLEESRYSIGTWHNKYDGIVYLDIVHTTPSLHEAMITAQRNQEIAIFYFKAFEEIFIRKNVYAEDDNPMLIGDISTLTIGPYKGILAKTYALMAKDFISPDSQIKIGQGSISIGENCQFKENAFISSRKAPVIIGREVGVFGGGEVLSEHIPAIVGAHTKIYHNGPAFIASTIGEYGDVVNSEIRYSYLLDTVRIEESKIQHSKVNNNTKIYNCSLIGGNVDGENVSWKVNGRPVNWRDSTVKYSVSGEEIERQYGIIVGKNCRMENIIVHHYGKNNAEEEMNPIEIKDNVRLSGNLFISSKNKNIVIEENVVIDVPKGSQLFIDGTISGGVVTRELARSIQNILLSGKFQRIEVLLNGLMEPSVQITGSEVSLEKTFSTNDRLKALLNQEIDRKEKAGEFDFVFKLNKTETVEFLNSLLEKHTLMFEEQDYCIAKDDQGQFFKVSLDGRSMEKLSTYDQNRARIIINQGCFLYQNVLFYCSKGKKIFINLEELANRGGARVIAETNDVQLGPSRGKNAGRISAYAILWDVTVDNEVNCFGGIMKDVAGNLKITLKTFGRAIGVRLEGLSGDQNIGEVIISLSSVENARFTILGPGNINVPHKVTIKGTKDAPVSLVNSTVQDIQIGYGSYIAANNLLITHSIPEGTIVDKEENFVDGALAAHDHFYTAA